MKIQNHLLRRRLIDILATSYLTIGALATTWFEIYVVLPEFHAKGSKLYIFGVILNLFFFQNIKGNIIAVMLCDSSIKGRKLNPPEDLSKRELWKVCSDCKILVPPRSWHCAICKTCILKRDHHCIFTASCIGHYNQRYFFMLLAFLLITSVYTTIYNTIFLWWIHADRYANWWITLKMLFPVVLFVEEALSGEVHFYIYVCDIFGGVMSIICLIYHGKAMIKGAVIYEKNKIQFNRGIRENFKMVLGEKWYLAWVSPIFRSDLPHDGIHWEEYLLEPKKFM